MKIAAGGLQVYATHDDVARRQNKESRQPDLAPKPQNNENLAAENKDGLNKTISRLNDAAKSFDLPLRFDYTKDINDELFIEMNRTDNDKTKALPLSEANALLDKMLEAKGFNVDEYI